MNMSQMNNISSMNNNNNKRFNKIINNIQLDNNKDPRYIDRNIIKRKEICNQIGKIIIKEK